MYIIVVMRIFGYAAGLSLLFLFYPGGVKLGHAVLTSFVLEIRRDADVLKHLDSSSRDGIHPAARNFFIEIVQNLCFGIADVSFCKIGGV